MNQNIIILSSGDLTEAWGSLVELCKVKGYSYNYLKSKSYPFIYKGVNFDRVPFRKENGIK